MAQNAPESHTPGPSDFLGIEEMVRDYPWPAGTLYAWRHRGIGPPSVRIGRRVLYRRSQVNQWIRDQAEAEQRRRAVVVGRTVSPR